MAERIGSLTNAWAPDDAHVLDALREAEVGELRLLYDSSNYVFLVDLEHPEYGTGLGVYKPQRGERPLADFSYGTLHRREVATFELSRLLGWDIVPPTVERDGPEGLGSMQLFIEHDPAEHYFELRDRKDLGEQMMRFAAFDIVANNADRKGGHLLLDAAGRVWGIDNALCFHRHEKLRTVIWDFAGEELAEQWRLDLRRVHDCMHDRDESTEPLRAYLSEPEVEAFVERAARLLAHPVLPEMYPWRCVPWPMI
jgi:uncharacterized repeat protein (TIGR03843 family)